MEPRTSVFVLWVIRKVGETYGTVADIAWTREALDAYERNDEECRYWITEMFPRS